MEMILSVFAILAGSYWSVKAFGYSLWVHNGPGGGLFPLAAGILCVVFGVSILVRQIRAGKHVFPLKAFHPMLSVVGIIAACYIVGMIPALTLYIVLWLKCYEHYRFGKSIAIGAVTGVCLYLVFVYWLYIPVPWGYFEKLMY